MHMYNMYAARLLAQSLHSLGLCLVGEVRVETVHVLMRAQVHQRREVLGAHVTAELGLRSAVVLYV